MPDSPISVEPIQFAYWIPNVSGGLVVSRIEQRTDWRYDYNKKLAVLAEAGPARARRRHGRHSGMTTTESRVHVVQDGLEALEVAAELAPADQARRGGARQSRPAAAPSTSGVSDR